jgi:hypothetical protein
MRKIQFVEDGCRVVVLGDALHPSYNSTGRATPRVIARGACHELDPENELQTSAYKI